MGGVGSWCLWSVSRGNWIGEAPYKHGRPCSECPPSYGGGCQNNLCYKGRRREGLSPGVAFTLGPQMGMAEMEIKSDLDGLTPAATPATI